MAWELKKVEDQRKQLIELYYANNLTMTDICARFGVSRKTAYKWLKRYEENGIKGLLDLSKTPHNPRILYSSKQIEKAIELKSKYSRWGPKKIVAKLSTIYPDEIWPSERRLYDVFKKQGLTQKRRLRRRVPATHPLGDIDNTNQIWTADFKGWFLTKNGEKCEPFTLADAHSRYVIRCVHLTNKDTTNVWAVLETAFKEYGLPVRFRTDNGPPFASAGAGRLSKLSINLIKAGVTPEWINPGHPEENGRHERFHLTLQEEAANPPAETLSGQLRRIRDFIEEYNNERPHEALNMKTPASCYMPSNRQWNGVLRSPEYNVQEGIVRKVTPGGTIWLKGGEAYIGSAFQGEYVFLRDGEQGQEVYYGPIFLGILEKGIGLRKPKKANEVPNLLKMCN